jgi:hypothetical protein
LKIPKKNIEKNNREPHSQKVKLNQIKLSNFLNNNTEVATKAVIKQCQYSDKNSKTRAKKKKKKKLPNRIKSKIYDFLKFKLFKRISNYKTFMARKLSHPQQTPSTP